MPQVSPLVSLQQVVTPISQSPALALARFHLAGGGRVASRNAIATIGAIIIVLGSAPAPLLWLRFLALGVAGTGHASGPLIGLAAIATALARAAVPRLTLGLGGWTRALPANGVQHRRGVMLGLPIIQLPLLAAVGLAVALTPTVYHVSISWAKVLGAVVALVAAGATAVPARRWPVATPLFAVSTLLAALGRWDALAASLVLFVIADRTAGGLRLPARRAAVATPATPETLRMFRFTWRALGWRLMAPAPMAALALAAAWFYTRNNELPAAEVGFVARLWSVIAIALYIGGVGDLIVSRRPAWPWIRSLPWSSRDRVIDDAIAAGAPALFVAALSGLVDPRAITIAAASIAPLGVLAAWLLHGARRRLTRVSGPMIVVGALFGTLIAYRPWTIVAALAATPLLLVGAARRDRREIVTGWKELHHDASGDSLAWSAR